jgi:hypothetical protein
MQMCPRYSYRLRHFGLDIISNDELMAKENPENYGGSHWERSGIKPEPPINPSVNPSVNQPIVTNPWNNTSVILTL